VLCVLQGISAAASKSIKTDPRVRCPAAPKKMTPSTGLFFLRQLFLGFIRIAPGTSFDVSFASNYCPRTQKVSTRPSFSFLALAIRQARSLAREKRSNYTQLFIICFVWKFEIEVVDNLIISFVRLLEMVD